MLEREFPSIGARQESEHGDAKRYRNVKIIGRQEVAFHFLQLLRRKLIILVKQQRETKGQRQNNRQPFTDDTFPGFRLLWEIGYRRGVLLFYNVFLHGGMLILRQ